jgi:SAM-dependent methyltransferase
MAEPGIRFTGERMVPGQVDQSLLMEHVARYQFAAGFAGGRRVLDAACGTGYGSFMLSMKAGQVVGIDLSPDAVTYACDNFKRDNLSFKVADILALPFKSETFDLSIAFEIFEHVENPSDMLTELKRVTSGNGKVIISTPNGSFEKSTVPNPFHVREYDFDEFSGIVSGVFGSKVSFYGQFNRSSSTAIKRQIIKLKRSMGIGPIFKKQAYGFENPSDLVDMETPYIFESEKIADAEFFIAIAEL